MVKGGRINSKCLCMPTICQARLWSAWACVFVCVCEYVCVFLIGNLLLSFATKEIKVERYSLTTCPLM